MIKEKAMPIGISALRNPIKIGTDEQEQNGVTAPKIEAEMFPTPNFCLANVSFNLWGDKNVRIKAIIAIMTNTRKYILIVSYTKKLILPPILEEGLKLKIE